MGYLLLLLAALCSVAVCQDYCNFTPPKQEINWKRITDGPWKWVAASYDSFFPNLVCSDLSVSGQPGVVASLNMTYGPLPHQIYSMVGKYKSRGVYQMEDFARSWRSIVRYKKAYSEWKPILDMEIETDKKGDMVFYTDYRSYLISAICLPTGDMSVGIYTFKPFITPRMKDKVRDVLEEHGIYTPVDDVRCRRRENKMLWSTG